MNDTLGFTLKDPDHKVLNRRMYNPDSVIFRMGDQGTDAFVILRGKVDIIVKGGDGKLKQLASMGEGELFGEMALLNDSRRTANAVTKEGCEVLVISQKTIEEKLASTDPFIRSWIKFLSDRILDMNAANLKKPKDKIKLSNKPEAEPNSKPSA